MLPTIIKGACKHFVIIRNLFTNGKQIMRTVNTSIVLLLKLSKMSSTLKNIHRKAPKICLKYTLSIIFKKYTSKKSLRQNKSERRSLWWLMAAFKSDSVQEKWIKSVSGNTIGFPGKKRSYSDFIHHCHYLLTAVVANFLFLNLNFAFLFLCVSLSGRDK